MMTTSTRPEAPKTTPRSTLWRAHVREEVTQGRAAAWLGWRVVRQRPALLFWRVLGVGTGQMLSTVLWAVIFGVMLVQVGLLGQDATIDGAFGSLVALCTSPVFIVGAIGCAACISAISWFADATSEAGVWEACALDIEEPAQRTSPWLRAPRHIAHVMMWQLFKGVTALAGGIVFLGVYIGLFHVQSIEMHAVFKALVLATIYAAGLIYAGLWIGLISWYPAMAIAHEAMHPGERLLVAARRALTFPVALYRLFLHVIVPALPFMVCSGLVSLGKWLTLQNPELNSLLSAVGLLVDLLTFVAVIAAGMAWRAGSSYLEAAWSGQIDGAEALVARYEARQALGKSAARSTFVHMGEPHPQQPEILDVEVGHLRPRSAPHILSLSAILNDSPAPMTGAESEQEEVL